MLGRQFRLSAIASVCTFWSKCWPAILNIPMWLLYAVEAVQSWRKNSGLTRPYTLSGVGEGVLSMQRTADLLMAMHEASFAIIDGSKKLCYVRLGRARVFAPEAARACTVAGSHFPCLGLSFAEVSLIFATHWRHRASALCLERWNTLCNSGRGCSLPHKACQLEFENPLGRFQKCSSRKYVSRPITFGKYMVATLLTNDNRRWTQSAHGCNVHPILCRPQGQIISTIHQIGILERKV
jgi:hypothetical protein